jgi:hypothetical protein
MSSASRLFAAAAVTVLVGAAAPGLARADGDPASDYLIVQPVYVPYDGDVPQPQAERLAKVVQDAKQKGYPIRVALIVSRADLGSVTALWRKPKPYAKFLGQELFYYYKKPLLIVMPNGYGVYHDKHPTASEEAVLRKLPVPGEGGTAIADAATNAVVKLAAAQGVKLAVPALAEEKHTSRTRDRITIVLIVVAGAAIGGLVALLRRRRRRSGELVREGPQE